MSDRLLPQAIDHVILDACCVINFYATGILSDLLAAISIQSVIVEYVRSKEALWIFDGPINDVQLSKQEIMLDPWVDSGQLNVTDIESELEARVFVNNALDLDDGEAMSAAIASCRNWAIATDEKKATRILTQDAPHVPVITTPDVIHHWANTSQMKGDQLSRVIQSVELRARYVPPKSHRLFEWWESISNR